MITIERRGKYGSLYEIDVCPTVDIRDRERKHWLTRRPRAIGKVALYPETNDWALGPVVNVYCGIRQVLAGEDVPESDIQVSEDGRRPLDMSGIRDGEYGRREQKLLNLWSSGVFKQIDSRKQADNYEKIATRKLGPYVVRYLVENYPEIVEDTILRRSIDEALMRTKRDIRVAVEARKVYGFPSDSEVANRVGLVVRRKTAAVIDAMADTMIYMNHSSGQYGPEWEWFTRIRSERAFLDSVRAAYPELPES